MLYRLKTDLPTFKAGDLFYIDRNGSLRHKNTDIVAYHYSTLMKFPNALEKFWEPVEKPPKRWRAYKGEFYYYVGYGGTVHQGLDAYGRLCNGNYKIGNYFATEEKARAYVDYLKALATVRDDAKGFVPDWKEGGQKWYVRASHCADGSNALCVDFTCAYQENGVFGLPYFESRADAEASIKKHRREWETIFGIEGETEDDGE